MREFVDQIWLGFSILRDNYASVIQAFRLVLADWRIHSSENEDKLNRLYKRFMVHEDQGYVKERLIDYCEVSIKNSMISSEKLNFVNEI